jgi:DNA end-binding protein Ku
VVSRGETVRGYEYAKGEYVVIREEQIKGAAPHTERQLEIVEFCRAEEIDPVWFETSYYLIPEPAGRRAYTVLMQAMRESQYIAVAQLSMHNREYLSLVRPSQLAGVPSTHVGRDREGLLLHTLFYLDEIRVAEGFGATAGVETGKAELNMARQLIEGLARPFDATRFEDHYRKNLEAVVAAALEGRPAPKREAAPRPAPVTDLMESLKQSLAGLEAKRPPAAERRDKKPAAKQTTKKKKVA